MMFIAGLNIGHYVRLFKRDFLVLFKLLMLEQKVLINGTFPVSEICNCLVSLIGLMPGLLSDAHSESLISVQSTAVSADSPRSQGIPLATSTLSPLERSAAFGLPLQIFDSMDRSDPEEEEGEEEEGEGEGQEYVVKTEDASTDGPSNPNR